MGEDADSFELSFSNDLQSVLKSWTSSTRISPVWRLTPTSKIKPKYGWSEETPDVFFISGKDPSWLTDNLSPECVDSLGQYGAWLSIGVYSLVVVALHNESKNEINSALKKQQITHEVWSCDAVEGMRKFSGSTIAYVSIDELTFGQPRAASPTLDKLRASASTRTDDTFGFMILELCTLLSVVHTRARHSFPAISEDCLAIEGLISGLLELDTMELPDEAATGAELTLPERLLSNPSKQDILLTLNAGLSRMVSQVFAGTSPIIRTECHFWPHSFLGIGVASLALRNISQFVTAILDESQYNDSYYTHLKSPFRQDAIHTRSSREAAPAFRSLQHSEWRKVGLSKKRRRDSASVAFEPAPNPITYFSGRDGFRNGMLTTSAPLNSIAGCNSYQWNLGTITHELSHRIIGGKLTELFLKTETSAQDSAENGRSMKEHMSQERATVEDVALQMLGNCLLVMVSWDFSGPDEARDAYSRIDSFFETARERFQVSFEELLVHAFDFFHFYGSDSKTYIDFVWQSWAVQPTIFEKLDEYIRRTLFALSVKHFDLPNWIELSIADFISVIESEPIASQTELRDLILRQLRTPEFLDSHRIFLELSTSLLCLFQFCFRCERLGTEATREVYASKKQARRKGKLGTERRTLSYPATVGVFIDDDVSVPRPAFSNPLRFIRDFSRQKEANASESAWLLHMLAFSFTPSASTRRGES